MADAVSGTVSVALTACAPTTPAGTVKPQTKAPVALVSTLHSTHPPGAQVSVTAFALEELLARKPVPFATTAAPTWAEAGVSVIFGTAGDGRIVDGAIIAWRAELGESGAGALVGPVGTLGSGPR